MCVSARHGTVFVGAPHLNTSEKLNMIAGLRWAAAKVWPLRHK